MKSEKRDFKKGFIIGMLAMLLLVIVASAALFLKAYQRSGQQKSDTVLLNEKTEEKLLGITNIIENYYYEDVDEDALVEGLYSGVVQGVSDPYSVYYTAKEYNSLMESTAGIYYGIGTQLTQNVNTMEVEIIRVFKGSPAEEAGLKAGDVIIKAGDVEAASIELAQFVLNIKGEAGTTVHLTIYRKEETKKLEFDVTRRQVETPTVEYQLLDGDVGLIQLTEFTQVTFEQFQNAVDDLTQQGMKFMIVDLRNNPGGLLDSVCNILDAILPEGLLVYTEDKNGKREELASDAEHAMDTPLAVLINKNSASASEIFAGAIKDYGYGTLIGTTSFGKGIVQKIFPLEDGSALKVTTSKYFTPKGNYIHDVGIEPDITLEYKYANEEDTTYDPMNDNQVQKAIEVLKK
ncbi:S41 family peptidase [Lachnospiraceae bacterium ZAX-1]